jgi:hypothetical protein
VEGSCEYIEQAVAHSRQGVVLQLGGFTAMCQQHLTVKTYDIMFFFISLTVIFCTRKNQVWRSQWRAVTSNYILLA